MRTRFILVAVVAAAIAAPPAGVLAGDKAQSTFVAPPGFFPVGNPVLTGPIGPWFTNSVSKGKTKGDDKCKVQILLSGLTGLADTDGVVGSGDEVICLGEATVTLGPAIPQATVLRGEVKAGKVLIKKDLSLEAIGCLPEGNGSNVVIYDSRATCYAPDAAFAPLITLPLLSDPTSGIVLGGVPRPASPMIATQGMHNL